MNSDIERSKRRNGNLRGLYEFEDEEISFEQQKLNHIENQEFEGRNTIDLNISECFICNNDVPSVDIEIQLKSKSKRIKGLKLRAGKCTHCSEVYLGTRESRAIEEIQKILNDLYAD